MCTDVVILRLRCNEVIGSKRVSRQVVTISGSLQNFYSVAGYSAFRNCPVKGLSTGFGKRRDAFKSIKFISLVTFVSSSDHLSGFYYCVGALAVKAKALIFNGLSACSRMVFPAS
ncbi:hypothetical protein [Thiomicrorhabdus sp. 6S3-12]|uniref:hypothetical protein n=1 Tax=Thiomicrorhabdus sp. 6S3-12 TaxID=2819681 RepID=UPI001AAC9429|nr:hypothetical protein [Thiomicrorhabdus sp. 6S3-12]MBO1924204.1 hypothetical protein [Thiomicrorhabdus sp. 6S3-12]